MYLHTPALSIHGVRRSARATKPQNRNDADTHAPAKAGGERSATHTHISRTLSQFVRADTHTHTAAKRCNTLQIESIISNTPPNTIMWIPHVFECVCVWCVLCCCMDYIDWYYSTHSLDALTHTRTAMCTDARYIFVFVFTRHIHTYTHTNPRP